MKRARGGMALLDVVTGSALLAVLLTLSLKMFETMSTGRAAVENQAIALQLVAGAVERVAALPWDQLTSERLDEIARKSSAGEVLPGAEMSVRLEAAAGEPAGRHVLAEVRWTNANAAQTAPVRLDYWRYAPAGASP